MKTRTMQRLRIVADALEAYSRDKSHSTAERTDAAIMLEDLARALNAFQVEPDYFGHDPKGGGAWQE